MRALLAAGLTLLLAAPLQAADVFIGVEGGRSSSSRWLLGLSPFSPKDDKSQEDIELARVLRGVVRDDLLFSRYFDLLEQGPAADAGADEAADFWKRRGAAFLLKATAHRQRKQVKLDARLVDLASGETLLARHYRQKSEFERSAAHRLSDDVVQQLTGRRGIARTRIAFVNDASGNKELCLIDYDGARLRRITEDRSINILPRWRPDGAAIAFTSYKDGNPDLFLYELGRKRVRTLSNRQGLNLAGGFSPDGTLLAATISRGKNPNIFVIDMETDRAKRVTSQWGVESSATFSPDSEHIAFVSDRAGNPQIYTMELATGRSRRLTRLNWCDSPSWSPTGEWIAFAGRANPRDKFDVFLVDVTGNRTLQLTHGEGSNEDPSWSPDGRFLVFTSTRDKRRRLYVMDADGSAPHPLGEPEGNSFTPSWGP